MDNRLLFIGGDKRMRYAAEALSERYSVSTLGLYTEETSPQGRYGTVVLPLPFMRGGSINAPFSEAPLPLSLVGEYIERGGRVLSGMLSDELKQLCTEYGAEVTDYFSDEVLTLKNALLTAEATVSLAVQNTDISLSGAKILITGGGRIAFCCARLLRSFDAAVTLCARSPIQRAKAGLEYFSAADISDIPRLCGSADIVVNTVPSPLFSESDIKKLSGALYIELASLPPEPYSTLCENSGVKYIHASGLPGRYSPKTAGLAIADTLCRLLPE